MSSHKTSPYEAEFDEAQTEVHELLAPMKYRDGSTSDPNEFIRASVDGILAKLRDACERTAAMNHEAHKCWCGDECTVHLISNEEKADHE